MAIIPALGTLRQDDCCEFKPSLEHMARCKFEIKHSLGFLYTYVYSYVSFSPLSQIPEIIYKEKELSELTSSGDFSQWLTDTCFGTCSKSFYHREGVANSTYPESKRERKEGTRDLLFLLRSPPTP